MHCVRVGYVAGRGLCTNPDGDERDSDEDKAGEDANDVGPDAGAVHEAVDEAQPPLQQRRVRQVQDDLQVPLHPWQVQGKTYGLLEDLVLPNTCSNYCVSLYTLVCLLRTQLLLC